MQTYLYRHFDKRGRLLYVGITADVDRRNKQHRTGTWGAFIARTTVETYPTRLKAAIAELQAMESEQPIHNVVPHSYRNSKLGVSTMLAIRLPKDTMERVDAACKKKKLSRSDFVRQALEKTLLRA